MPKVIIDNEEFIFKSIKELSTTKVEKDEQSDLVVIKITLKANGKSKTFFFRDFEDSIIDRGRLRVTTSLGKAAVFSEGHLALLWPIMHSIENIVMDNGDVSTVKLDKTVIIQTAYTLPK